MKKIILISILLVQIFLVQSVMGEYTGILDIGNTQYPPTGMVAGTTGLGTEEQCYYDSQCNSGYCKADENNGKKYCVSSANDCVYDGNIIEAGTSECISTDTVGTCSDSGTFSTTLCEEGKHCSGGVCVADTQSQDNSNSGENEAQNTPASSIVIGTLSNIEIVQGQTKKVKVEITNNGERDLTDVKLSLEGLPLAMYKISDESFSLLSKGEKKYSYLAFAVPEKNEIKIYTIKLTASAKDTSGVSISDSETFLLKVLPSEESKKEVNQTYLNYTNVLSDLEKKINQEKLSGNDVSEAESLLIVAKQELGEVKKKIDKGNYYEAIQLMNDVASKIDQIEQSLKQVDSESNNNSKILWFMVYAVAIVVVALIAYYFYSERNKTTIFSELRKKVTEPEEDKTSVSYKNIKDAKFREHAKRVHQYIKNLFKKDKSGFGYAS
ncbi:MAG: hypothetical protein DRO96_00590 [Candidatus Aenigmatarchaeota archaeon]|nr:MAG: hypothetical protein DRO96_00590 [Candidatus Aenigmarchaeota archaeon]